MKRKHLTGITKTVALAIGMIVLVQSCKKDEETHRDTFEGPKVAMGSGKTYTWVKLRANGEPEQLGITLTKEAMENLPQNPADHEHNSVTVALPAKASGTPFNHVTVDWNPAGHPPDDIFDVPHFDFHFYTMSVAERLQIPPYEVDASKHDIMPAAGYMPADYERTPGGVPAMGVHWTDKTAPEFNGEPFTYSFLYGSYNGKTTFLEPMVKYQFLKDGNAVDYTIKLPQKFDKTGYYPTRFRLYKENDLYQIVLEDFVFRNKS